MKPSRQARLSWRLTAHNWTSSSRMYQLHEHRATDPDARSREHIKAMEYWVSGNLEWSLATPRYFGKESTRVRETLHVRMSLPENPGHNS